MNLRKKISNTPYLTNTPFIAVNSHDAEHILSISDLEFWHQVKNDIITIAEIIKNGEKEDNGEDLLFLSKRK